MKAPRPWLRLDYQEEALVFRMPGGLPVSTHYSFLLAALILSFPFWLQGRLASIVVGLLLVAILHLSILAHELGHVYAARAQGADARIIEIHFFGGHAELLWDEHRGLDMRRVALAGPMVNFALAGAFFAAYWLVASFAVAEAPKTVGPFHAPGIAERTLYFAALMNLVLGLINLLPAFPLDGGVIAQDLLTRRLGDRRATLIVACCGVVLSVLSVLIAIGTLLSGFPIVAPLSFKYNLEVARESWRAPPPPASVATTTFANGSVVITFRPRPTKPE